MSLKVISDYLKKIFIGNDHSKLKYKKKHKKHYRTHQKKRGKKTKRKMHIRAGANATIKKERRNRARKVMYPGIKPTINADEINNLDKLIKMKKEIKKKIKKLPSGEKFQDNIYEILKDIDEHILNIYKSRAESEPDILPGIEEFNDISPSIISDEEAAAKAKAERERLAAEEAKAKADEEAVIEGEFPIPSLPQGELENDDYFNQLETSGI